MEQTRLPKFHSTTSEINIDHKYTRDEYLEMVCDFKSSFPDPIVENYNGISVVREDLITVGSKARAGEALVANCKSDTIVYVQPRFGFAGISLTELCNKYGKKLILFMPSSKQVSEHQAYCIENGCEYHFYRIAAMPNLNKIAERYAKETGAYFIPLGLKHPLVTAMIIKTAINIAEPESFWTAFSTGVLNRALQIAWPNAIANGLAVARNIHHGEKGRANIIGHYQLFSQNSKTLPPFPSASNYDAKVWEYLKPGDLFWNVAGEIKSTIDKTKIQSYKNWKNESN
jgi:hypothetical protein